MRTVTRAARPIAPDHDRILFEAGIDPMLGPSARRDALRAAIARHGGAIDWTVDHTGWVVTLYFPAEGTFAGGTLEAGLLSCLAWLIAMESAAEPTRA